MSPLRIRSRSTLWPAISLSAFALVGCARQSTYTAVPTLDRSAEVYLPTNAQTAPPPNVLSAPRPSLDASPEASPEASLDASVSEDVVTDTANDSATTTPHALQCAQDTDCVLVTGGCAGPMAAHREHAAEVDAQNQRLLSVATCDGRFAARPVRAVCTQGRCVLDPMDHPEWRVCERTRECLPVHRNCQHWQSINRRFEREARDSLRLSQPCGPTVTTPPPRIECRYGWCVTGWAGR